MTMPIPPEKFEVPQLDVADVAETAERLHAAMAGDVWTKATFEQKQQIIMRGLREVGATLEEQALRDSTTTAERIEVEGVVSEASPQTTPTTLRQSA